MYYQESDTIANRQPDLSDDIARLDDYLYANQGTPVRASRAADFLSIKDRVVDSLLKIYELQGVVVPVEMVVCPHCDVLIEEDHRGGRVTCDLCERAYNLDKIPSETAYTPRATHFECGDEIKIPKKVTGEVDGLFTIIGCGNEARVGDVVFVHGLDGDAKTTWHPQDKPEHFWPKWLGEDDPTLGVWCAGYDAYSLAWKGSALPLADRATAFLARFEAAGIGDRPLVLIGHSLGGLVIKQLLRHAHDLGNTYWKALVGNTRGVVFLSTPHSGSDLANYVQYVSKVLRPTVAAEELEAHHSRLRELNLWYRNNAPSLGIATDAYYETKTTYKFLVVDPSSADPGIAGVVPIPIERNHQDICKPTSRSDLVYCRVRQFVDRCMSRGS
jgi:pimeloyl-ACP methyl ester carboxylesterase